MNFHCTLNRIKYIGTSNIVSHFFNSTYIWLIRLLLFLIIKIYPLKLRFVKQKMAYSLNFPIKGKVPHTDSCQLQIKENFFNPKRTATFKMKTILYIYIKDKKNTNTKHSFNNWNVKNNVCFEALVNYRDVFVSDYLSNWTRFKESRPSYE